MSDIFAKLTTSGWVLAAFVLCVWLGFIANLIGIARGDSAAGKRLSNSVLAVAVLTIWFIYLVT